MDIFNCLLIGHLVGDFLLQSNWMATHKEKDWRALAVHSLVYTITIYLFSLIAGGLSLLALVIIFAAHVILDQRGVVRWWLTNVSKSPDLTWLQIMVDQTLHLLVLFVIALCK